MKELAETIKFHAKSTAQQNPTQSITYKTEWKQENEISVQLAKCKIEN